MIIDFFAVFFFKIDNYIETEGFFFFVEEKSVHFEDAFVRKDDSLDLFAGFYGGLVSRVY